MITAITPAFTPSSTFGFDFAALDLDCIQSASLGFGLHFRWIGLDPFQKIKQGLDLDWFWPARTWIWIASAQPCLGFGLVLGFGSVFNLLNLNQVTYRPPGKLPGAGEQSIVGGIEKCTRRASSAKLRTTPRASTAGFSGSVSACRRISS